MSTHFYAVVLAGGYGERFWPASTMRRPKQLLQLLGDRTMLEMAVDRLEGLIPPERVLVLTSADLVEPTIERSPDLPPANIIGEPCRRDTAAAVALAAAVVSARDPEGVFCVLTADHVMGDLDLFRATLAAGLEVAAGNDVLVTIGINPTEPSTAYGYVEAGEPYGAPGDVPFYAVDRFVEKPDVDTATEYLATGRFRWNSGMFAWSAASVQAAFARHTPELSAFIDNLRPAVDTDGFAAALAEGFEPLEKISIDYALMERADNIVMAEGSFAWTDVGSWPEVAEQLGAGADGNATNTEVASLDATGNLVVAQGDNQRLTALIGVTDLVVVHTAGVTLICPKDRAQDVKKMVTQLRDAGGHDDLL